MLWSAPAWLTSIAASITAVEKRMATPVSMTTDGRLRRTTDPRRLRMSSPPPQTDPAGARGMRIRDWSERYSVALTPNASASASATLHRCSGWSAGEKRRSRSARARSLVRTVSRSQAGLRMAR